MCGGGAGHVQRVVRQLLQTELNHLLVEQDLWPQQRNPP